MSRLKCLVAACTLALTVGATNANTITVDILPFSPTISGTLTLDLTAGAFTGIDMVVSGFPAFIAIGSQGPSASGWFLQAFNSNLDSVGFDISTHFAGTAHPLDEFDLFGGAIVDGHIITLSGGVFSLCGSPPCANLAPEVATTPLPAALPLFATGLGALGLLGWRRKRKAQAAV